MSLYRRETQYEIVSRHAREQRLTVSADRKFPPLSPRRVKILELLKPDDPGRDELEAIVRATPRRGLIKPYDEDTWRFLQRTHPPNAQSTPVAEKEQTSPKKQPRQPDSKRERSLADELREAEEDEQSGSHIRRELLREFRKRGGGIREALERERLGKLALAVEDDEDDFEDENGLTAAARRIDALLAESRNLHEELAEIHEDIQVLARRVTRRDP
ncbi:uncharacterized protein LOC123705824 isoform X2 [Colias croceus]|uniref:uncharacterized protein LOC123705824 isoform X2 n=1 Tax=Colias crocea TaxID=72248 RepID=UPI001E27AF59|nr:uncharacterized protein LOC123705824 isoform X2 [Colias croceus]XP_045510814.1 uncharacterized protein LOC123705824 isoform X2 [Colias croceus]